MIYKHSLFAIKFQYQKMQHLPFPPVAFLLRPQFWLVLGVSLLALGQSLFGAPERPTLGAADAPISILEVRSFGCSHCQQFHEAIFPPLKQQFIDTGKVSWSMLDTLTDPGEDATILRVAHCLHAQGLYWQNNAFLFAHSDQRPAFLIFETEDLESVEMEALQACLEADETEAYVQAQLAAVKELKITTLPTLILRKQRWDGATIELRIEGDTTVEAVRRKIAQLQQMR
ncbi:MAG: DSBA oxidoreductase [Puniceicoccaceae bacterium 5H]|nr:MAG: DSBA oxidoreductase [Puniceicoccaceae bacterium 5H]